MVRACNQCDDSKQAADFEKLMNGDAPLSPRIRDVMDIPQRVRHIRDYVRHFGYEAQLIEERPDEGATEELKQIRIYLIEDRRRLEQLIANRHARAY